MKKLIVTIKIILGIILGLALSFATIVCLEILLPRPNPFRKEGLNLWLVGPIITAWLFLMLWLVLRKPSPKTIRTKGFEHLPASISEVVDGIIHAMRYRKSVQTEVRQELTDHFTDALSDCREEEEKQKRIQELIEDFGNIELLGTLIRRGKKRCQSLWRKIVTHIPHAIGILFILLIFYVVWFFTGKPQVTTDYLVVFNQQVRPQVDESQNAWPYYEQAVQAYEKAKVFEIKTGNLVINERQEDGALYQEGEVIELDTTPRRLNAVSHEEMQILNEWLTDNRHALELIRQGNQKPYYWRNYYGGEHDPTELMGILLPNLTELRELTRLLCWEGMIAADEGDFNNAFDLLLESFSFGHHIRGRNTPLIEQLVAMAMENYSTKTLRILMEQYSEHIDPAAITDIRQQFENMINNEDFLVDYKSEKLFLYDETQRCFTQSRFGKSHLFLPRLMSLGSLNIEDEDFGYAVKHGFHILFTHPDKGETLKAIDAFYDKLEEMAQKTPATLYKEDNDWSSQVEKLVEGNLFLEILTPALARIVIRSYGCRIDSYATLATLAIVEYQKEYGHLPDSLDELVQHQLLKEVPVDPFSNQPLTYHKTENGFTVYSVGSNFTDDGGVQAKDNQGELRQWGDNGDWIFWPPNP